MGGIVDSVEGFDCGYFIPNRNINDKSYEAISDVYDGFIICDL